MKRNIHPKLDYIDVHCRCGNAFKIKSTMNARNALNLERCGNCLMKNIGAYTKIQGEGSARERLFKDFNISDLVG